MNNIVANEGPISFVHVTQGSYSLMTSFCRSFNLQILTHCGVSVVKLRLCLPYTFHERLKQFMRMRQNFLSVTGVEKKLNNMVIQYLPCVDLELF